MHTNGKKQCSDYLDHVNLRDENLTDMLFIDLPRVGGIPHGNQPSI
jgi:hypothetical protein